MIGVQEAITKVLEHTPVMKQGISALSDSCGLTLSNAIFSRHDHPQFQQAAMDGYAFRYQDLANGQAIRIIGESAAGSHDKITLGSHEATRIFTGAPVPEGADTVVMQEKVRVDGGRLLILDDAIRSGSNVRPAGSEISKGDCALEASTLLTPAAIGFLAGLGFTELPVISPPRISIIATGNRTSPSPYCPFRKCVSPVFFWKAVAIGRMMVSNAGFCLPSIFRRAGSTYK